jgi:hypothetical protein
LIIIGKNIKTAILFTCYERTGKSVLLVAARQPDYKRGNGHNRHRVIPNKGWRGKQAGRSARNSRTKKARKKEDAITCSSYRHNCNAIGMQSVSFLHLS